MSAVDDIIAKANQSIGYSEALSEMVNWAAQHNGILDQDTLVALTKHIVWLIDHRKPISEIAAA